MPPGKRGKKRNKPYVTPEQFDALVNLIAEPYATMVYVAVYTGLRVSKLIELRWADVGDGHITIDERCCRGDWGAPKSEASNATIPVNAAVIQANSSAGNPHCRGQGRTRNKTIQTRKGGRSQ